MTNSKPVNRTFKWNPSPKDVGIVTLGPKGFQVVDIDVPLKPTFLYITVPCNVFNQQAKFEFGKHKPFTTGKSLWTSGMQQRIVTEVMIISDDIEDGLFAAANFQNDQSYPFIFGKLLPCDLTDKILNLFLEFAHQVGR